MSDPHLICIDIDGTLTVDFPGTVPQENRTAIEQARARGHKVVVNTGRSYFNLPSTLLDPSFPLDGVICANGSYIRFGDEIVRNETFAPDLLRDLLSFFLFEDDRFALFEGETMLLKTRTRSDLYGDPGVQIYHPDEMNDKFKGVGFNDFSCEGKLSDAFLARFAHRLELFQCETFADGTVPGCSKAVGMHLAASHLGIPMTRTVAIGDSANDVPMLREAAVSVVMGNAADHVKRGADLVTRSNLDCGVAEAIRKLFL